jgi:HPt (histidine-containing phosphotransfer) domain-containing protein
VELFENYRSDIDSLPTLIQQNQRRECQFILHKLKSAAANLGAERLSALCATFEANAATMGQENLGNQAVSIAEEFGRATAQIRILIKKAT